MECACDYPRDPFPKLPLKFLHSTDFVVGRGRALGPRGGTWKQRRMWWQEPRQVEQVVQRENGSTEKKP